MISIHNAENWLGGEGDDFAPNFFSAVIPPEAGSAATPASSSESVGVASGVSSRSQTPEEVSGAGTVSPAEPKPASELAATGNEVNAVTASSSDESASKVTIQTPEAAVSASLPETTTESVASGNPASLTGDVKTENLLDTAITDGVTRSAESAAKREENGQNERSTPEAATKVEDGQSSLTERSKCIVTFLLYVFFSFLETAVDSSYNSDKVTFDEHCYECKVRFRDPKPKDLMMFLHAWRYKVSKKYLTRIRHFCKLIFNLHFSY